jgi:hypothetical protein
MAYYADSCYRLLIELRSLMMKDDWMATVECSRKELILTFPANGKFGQIIEKCYGDEIGGGYQEALNGKTFEITVKQV